MLKVRNAIVSWALGTTGRIVVLAGGLWSANASATGFVYQFDNAFSGMAPNGPAPWVDATFQDTANGVLLTLNNVDLKSGEFVSGLYLNLDPADSAQLSKLKFTLEGGTVGVTAPTIQTGEDSFKADGDGKYDILFSFSTANSASGRFGTGDSLTYLISGFSGLTSSDFLFLSTPAGGSGPFDAAAHIQGITGCDTSSGWIEPSGGASPIPTPEPAPIAIIALAGGLLGIGRWWVRKK